MTALSCGGGKGSLVAVRMLLKGMHWGYRARKDGSRTYYFYAWKDGPQIWKGDQLPAEISPDHPVVAAYQAAHKAQREKRAVGFVSGLVADFRESTEFNAMAPTTKAQWRVWLDLIEDEFGEMELEALDDRGVRKEFIAWRDKRKHTPRSADYGIQVLKRLLSFALNRGDVDFNRALGIRTIYRSDGRAEKIWTEADIKAACDHEDTPQAVADAIRLGALTGLRRGDLIALRWDEVRENEIVRPTQKSRGRHTAHIPLLAETRTLLGDIKKRRGEVPSVNVLTSVSGKVWQATHITHQVTDAAKRIEKDLRLHDLRGTFVTRLCIADLPDQEIADIVGWSIPAVAKMRRVYVSQGAVSAARLLKLEKR